MVEEVAVKLETDLTAMRVRAAGLEGSLRARDREVRVCVCVFEGGVYRLGET